MPGGNPGISEAESGNFIWSRRDLLSLAGWGAILTCFAAAGGAILRLLFPRVLFEPPPSFTAGYPTEFTLGDDGQLVVDKAFRYRYELGQWDDPNAFVKYSGA